MTATPNPNDLAAVLDQLQQADPDLLRSMLTAFVQALMSADADAVCGAEYGVRSPDRTNRRNGYRSREWDTRAGTIELAIPKLREGSYFPDWLLERRKRAERALISVVATSYLTCLLVSTISSGDEVSMARFIADQRTGYQVPHTLTCLLLGASPEVESEGAQLCRDPFPVTAALLELDVGSCLVRCGFLR